MSPGIDRYKKGYSLGVGGVVIKNNKVLLVRRLQSDHNGPWTIPGGYVEKDETIDTAVKREVLEEAGVKTEIKGIIAVRSRIHKDENSMYLIFLLETKDEKPTPDLTEVDAAQFFSLVEVKKLEKFQNLSKIFALNALLGKTKLLTKINQADFPPDEYKIFG